MLRERVSVGAAIDLRQQQRACLHRAFPGDEAAGFGGGQLRIAGARQLVGLQQVLGVCAGGGQQGDGEGEDEGAAAHAGSLVNGSVRTGMRGSARRRRDRADTVSNNDSMR